jgi:hypothetical protein
MSTACSWDWGSLALGAALVFLFAILAVFLWGFIKLTRKL